MTEPTDEEWQVCAVCARVLSRLKDSRGETVEWQHPYDMTLKEPEDHPPVPVSPSEISTDARCDFCFRQNPRWVLPVRDFQYANMPPNMPFDYGSHGGWAACDACADLLNRGLWSDLTRRGIASFFSRNPEGNTLPEIKPFVTMQLTTMYRQLRKNVSGSIVPNPDYRPEE